MVWEYRPDEPYVGEGPWLRTRRGRVVTVVVAILVAAILLAMMFLPRFFGARGLDPGLNARTGLADGTYTLVPIASFHQDGECWFRGTASPGGADVTVFGRGLAQCGMVGDSIGRVTVTVHAGIASISRIRS